MVKQLMVKNQWPAKSEDAQKLIVVWHFLKRYAPIEILSPIPGWFMAVQTGDWGSSAA